MTCATDGPGDDNAGVDPDADRKLAGELLGNKAVSQHRSGHDGIGMIREAIRGTKDRQSAVTEQLVDVPARVDDGRTTISNSALNRATVSSAVSASENGVKSRMSTNITVTWRRPPVNTSSPCASSRAARAGGRKSRTPPEVVAAQPNRSACGSATPQAGSRRLGSTVAHGNHLGPGSDQTASVN